MTTTVTIICPLCEENHDLTGTVTHDPGCWRDKNGDGWPESWEVDFDPTQCPKMGEDFPQSVEEAFIKEYYEANAYEPDEEDWRDDR